MALQAAAAAAASTFLLVLLPTALGLLTTRGGGDVFTILAPAPPPDEDDISLEEHLGRDEEKEEELNLRPIVGILAEVSEKKHLFPTAGKKMFESFNFYQQVVKLQEQQ